MNLSIGQTEALPPRQHDDGVSLKQRLAAMRTRKRSVRSNDDTKKRLRPVQRTKSLPTHLLPEYAGKPLFWFLAKEQDHSMMLSTSSLMEDTDATSNSGDTDDTLHEWSQDETASMDLSCSLSVTSAHSLLNASDALLGLDFVTQDDDTM